MSGSIAAICYAQDKCTVSANFKIVDATGYVYDGSFKRCKSALDGNYRYIETTTGSFAPALGQNIFLVGSRWFDVPQVGVLVRAVLNKPYSIHLTLKEAKDGGLVRSGGGPSQTWLNQSVILPFAPTRVLEVSADKSNPVYVYGGLVPLPGFANKMFPLNSDSFIVGYNGFSFGREDGLQRRWSDTDEQYVEIIYVQAGSNVLQRTFIPILNAKDPIVRQAWNRTITAYPLVSSDSSSDYRLIKLGALVVAMGAMAALNDSAVGEYFRRNNAEERCFALFGVRHPNC